MIALVLALTITSPVAQEPGSTSIWAGIEIVDIEGRRYTTGDLEGRVVLLDFWATWCAPCLDEIPILMRARERHSEQDLLLIGISLDQAPRRDLLGFLRRQQISWPQVHDGRGLNGDLARRFRVEAVPRSVLVDARGNVVALDLRGEVLLAALEGLL